jgi:hypothetical protein
VNRYIKNRYIKKRKKKSHITHFKNSLSIHVGIS